MNQLTAYLKEYCKDPRDWHCRGRSVRENKGEYL